MRARAHSESYYVTCLFTLSGVTPSRFMPAWSAVGWPISNQACTLEKMLRWDFLCGACFGPAWATGAIIHSVCRSCRGFAIFSACCNLRNWDFYFKVSCGNLNSLRFKAYNFLCRPCQDVTWCVGVMSASGRRDCYYSLPVLIVSGVCNIY